MIYIKYYPILRKFVSSLIKIASKTNFLILFLPTLLWTTS